MKTKLTLLFIWVIFSNIYAQISFQKHIIATDVEGAISVYATDIDGDDNTDVLSISHNNSTVAWYKNDGMGGFGAQQIISTNLDSGMSVYAADLDNDGYTDVLSASRDDYKIAWYKNTDGLGNFGTQQIISIEADQAQSVFAIDIDGDNAIDVLSASAYDNKIAWYKNLDGLGTFGVQQIITTNAVTARSVFAIDIDGDGDIDVLSGSANDNKVAWYKNLDGLGNFGTQQLIATDAWAVNSVYATDIDDDGDMDVLAALLGTGTIVWYINTDGLGNFSTQQVITTNANTATSVYAVDLDNDADMDVLSSSRDDNKIAWYENINGLGTFGAQQVISNNANGANSVYASDIDNDGYFDVLSASYNDNTIAWYKNSGNLSVGQNQLINFSIYPNPTTGVLTIDSQTVISQIAVYNQLGQLLLENTKINKIDISGLNQGLYLVKVTDMNENIAFKKVIKR